MPSEIAALIDKPHLLIKGGFLDIDIAPFESIKQELRQPGVQNMKRIPIRRQNTLRVID